MLRLRQFLGAPFFTPFIIYIFYNDPRGPPIVGSLVSYGFLYSRPRSRWFTVIHQSCGSCRWVWYVSKNHGFPSKKDTFLVKSNHLVTTDVLKILPWLCLSFLMFWSSLSLLFLLPIVGPWFGNILGTSATGRTGPPRPRPRASPDGKSSQVGQSRCDRNGRCSVVTSDEKVNCCKPRSPPPPFVRALCSEQGSWKITKLPHFGGIKQLQMLLHTCIVSGLVM